MMNIKHQFSMYSLGPYTGCLNCQRPKENFIFQKLRKLRGIAKNSEICRGAQFFPSNYGQLKSRPKEFMQIPDFFCQNFNFNIPTSFDYCVGFSVPNFKRLVKFGKNLTTNELKL